MRLGISAYAIYQKALQRNLRCVWIGVSFSVVMDAQGRLKAMGNSWRSLHDILLLSDGTESMFEADKFT